MNDVDMVTVAKLLGHALVETTERYVRIPAQTDHRFRSYPITDSGANWTVIPVGSRSLFRSAPERCKGPEGRS